jgi:uncharacterized protein YcgI (DUF1989 family)
VVTNFPAISKWYNVGGKRPAESRIQRNFKMKIILNTDFGQHFVFFSSCNQNTQTNSLKKSNQSQKIDKDIYTKYEWQKILKVEA